MILAAAVAVASARLLATLQDVTKMC